MLSWTYDDFIQLGASSTLQSLSYKGLSFHESHLIAVEDLPTSIFPALCQLKISYIYEPTSLRLFSLIPLLRRLDLHFDYEPGPNFLRCLSGSGVRDLFIVVNNGRMLYRDDLNTLAEKCPFLESLHICAFVYCEDPEVGGIVGEFVQRALNLRSFEIRFIPLGLSPNRNYLFDMDIFEIFNHEPRRHFKSLVLPVRLKTSSIHRHRNDNPPMFPYLESLGVKYIESDKKIGRGRFIKYLAQAAPLLKSIELPLRADEKSRKFKKV